VYIEYGNPAPFAPDPCVSANNTVGCGAYAIDVNFSFNPNNGTYGALIKVR
jgi:hypothetical protein